MVIDPLEPYKRAGRNFKKSADASARRFKAKVQYACDKARADAESLHAQIEQARAEFFAELEEARVKYHIGKSPIEPPPPPAQGDLEEFLREQKAVSQIRGRKVEEEVVLCRALKARRARRDPRYRRWDQRRKRPPRDLGGEPAPVKPRPNPTPLMDGAEAPIE